MDHFRKYHLLQILRQFSQKKIPIDVFLNNYYRKNKALGSKDRQEISEKIYGMIRHLSLIDYLCPEPCWEKKLKIYIDENFNSYKHESIIPDHIRYGLPLNLLQKFIKQYGQEKAFEIARISQEEAPVTIRVNTLKTNRKELYAQLSKKYDVHLCSYSDLAIQFTKRVNFQEMEEFKGGLFEVQDEASQLVSFLVKAQPKDKVLDFCAGAGGKTLGFAPFLQNKGIIFLHDIRPLALQQARKRLARAGIHNAQFLNAMTCSHKMDWILLDVPCSGSGTYRRNVDLKWKFSDLMLDNLLKEQRIIFKNAMKYLKEGGKIVYATCSLLREENEDQIDYFMSEYDLELVDSPFVSMPISQGMDGFFGATLIKKYV